MSKKSFGLYAATSVVIANMIGSGVFTSLGFQLLDIHSVFSIMLLWILGGVAALCGALSYGELAAALPRSGSEYNYLSKIYHPAMGFLSGWVSATVGFAAPVALSSMLMASYASKVFGEISQAWLAAAAIIVFTLIHAGSTKTGGRFQSIFTSVNILLIIFIIASGFLSGNHQAITLLPGPSSWKEFVSPGFAIGLFWVSYSYSGWNASAYMAGEIENAQKNVPRSLFTGTIFVMILYVLLNFIFLYTTPASEIAGQKEVGFIASSHIFGDTGARVIGLVISALLASSVSSMMMAGPRVTQVMGEDNRLLQAFSHKNRKGIPVRAIMLQAAIALVLIFTSSFEQVLIYIGFTLNIFTFFTVLGLFVLRFRQPQLPRPYKTWGYPVTPFLFLCVTLWILCYGLYQKPHESIAGLFTVLSGLIVYFAGRKKSPSV